MKKAFIIKILCISFISANDYSDKDKRGKNQRKFSIIFILTYNFILKTLT